MLVMQANQSERELLWAAPSWVIPGTIVQNAEFLNGKTSHIALCMFETSASLDYGPNDLPSELSRCNFTWHVHLPLDLPWHMGAVHVAKICDRLAQKIAFLKPVAAVLHPPTGCRQRQLLARLSQCLDRLPMPILLENTCDCDIVSLGKGFLKDFGFGFCLDVGHALGYAQNTLLESFLPAMASIAHWSAPVGGHAHASLAMLTDGQQKVALRIMGLLSNSTIHVMEIFDWHGVEQSLPILLALREGKK